MARHCQVLLRQLMRQRLSLPALSVFPVWMTQISKIHSTHVNAHKKSSLEQALDAKLKAQPITSEAEYNKKLELIKAELEYWRSIGKRVPTEVTDEELKELVAMSEYSERESYAYYLRKKELQKIGDKERKERNKKLHEEKRASFRLEAENNKHLKYCLFNNTMFMRISNTKMDRFYNHRIADAISFGQKIVVDLGFEEAMSKREIINLAQQLSILYGANKAHKSPFALYFCNLREGFQKERIQVSMQNIGTATNLTHITEQSYLDLFPREKLVYLTPHCKEPLLKYDHDAVYIIGGIVDKVNPAKLSLAKAKELGIKMACLPFDHHLNWGCGHKSLTLDQVMRIMLDMKCTNDWKVALRHVPSRKLKPAHTVLAPSATGNRPTFKTGRGKLI